MSKVRKTPRTVAGEAEERAYREREDSTADLDWRRAEHLRLPNLEPVGRADHLRGAPWRPIRLQKRRRACLS